MLEKLSGDATYPHIESLYGRSLNTVRSWKWSDCWHWCTGTKIHQSSAFVAATLELRGNMKAAQLIPASARHHEARDHINVNTRYFGVVKKDPAEILLDH